MRKERTIKVLDILLTVLNLGVGVLLIDWLTDLLEPALGFESLAWFLALIAVIIAGRLIDALIHTVNKTVKQEKSEEETE